MCSSSKLLLCSQYVSVKLAGKAFHLSAALLLLQYNRQLLLAGVHLAEVQEPGEVHLIASFLFFACVDVTIEFKFYFHLLLKSLRLLLNKILPNANWYPKLENLRMRYFNQAFLCLYSKF